MGYAFDERPFARISKDCLKEGGRFLPIRSTLRRIPVAAFGLKKYLCGTPWVSMQGNNVDATALLGDSEVFAVKHTPRHTIPEFVQRFEYDGEVSSSVAREKAVHVFEDNGSRHASSNEAHKVVKEARLPPSKPRSRPHSRQAEVLARESGCPNIGIRDICMFDLSYVRFPQGCGPVLLEDVEAERLSLTLECNSEAGPLQAKVQAPDTCEE